MTRFVRRLRLRASAPVLLVALLFAPTAGCPGQLENAAELSQLPSCPGNIDVRDLFLTKCGSSICHGASDDPAGSAACLDLVSPGLESRLVNVETQKCRGLLRIDPNEPDQSFLLAKVIDPPAGCGNRMPLVGLLRPDELSCLRAFIHEMAQAPVNPTPIPNACHVDAGMRDAQ